MNNACPTCGTVYAVAAKDIGRKIKCKKCGTALLVEDDGLVVDSPKPAAVEVADDADGYDADDDASPRPRKGKKSQRQSGDGPGFGAVLAKVGGIPTILFAIGVALVIWYYFMPRIGHAAEKKAAATPARLQMDLKNREEAALPKGKATRADLNDDERKKYDDEVKKIEEEYKPKLREAEKELAETKVDNDRDRKGELYGTLFGFLFVAFGCIGYLRTEQPLVMRIVAAVILTIMMIIVFVSMGGCDKLGGIG